MQWLNVGRENSSDVGCVQTELLNRLNDLEQHITPPLNTDYTATRKTLEQLLVYYFMFKFNIFNFCSITKFRLY